MQGARVWSVVGDLDPTCPAKTQCGQTERWINIFINTTSVLRKFVSQKKVDAVRRGKKHH